MVWRIAWREIRLGFRNPWAYSFLALFSLFNIALMLVQSHQSLQGYTHTTGALINLTLYLLPLMTILLGAFAITSEREDGGWELLSTLPLSTTSLLTGKYCGVLVVLCVIVCFGFGISGLLSAIFGVPLALSTLLFFLAFSLLLVIVFLAIALLVGTVSRNRWQALTIGVGLWFVLIIGWFTFLVSTLVYVPYLWIKPLIITLTFLNPAELIRIYMVTKMGGGSIFGPEYAAWLDWMQHPASVFGFAGVLIVWILGMLVLSIFIWERRRRRG